MIQVEQNEHTCIFSESNSSQRLNNKCKPRSNSIDQRYVDVTSKEMTHLCTSFEIPLHSSWTKPLQQQQKQPLEQRQQPQMQQQKKGAVWQERQDSVRS